MGRSAGDDVSLVTFSASAAVRKEVGGGGAV